VNHIVIQYSSDNGVKIIRYGLRNKAKMRKSGIEGFGRCGQPDHRTRKTAFPASPSHLEIWARALQPFLTHHNAQINSTRQDRSVTTVMAAPPGKIDRQTTTPFYLKLFYRNGAFHR
jgi:hypothetical protein